jgi:probable HAF family extracellular repeat protein
MTAPLLESLEGRALLAYGITPLGQVALPAFVDVTQGIVAINSAAEVAATGLSGNSSEAYFLNNNGQTTWLTPLQGGASTTATALNASGEVVGFSSTNGGGGGMGGSAINEAVLYSGQGQPTDLGNLGGTSQATGINDSGQVVGYSATGTAYNSPTHAFLYSSLAESPHPSEIVPLSAGSRGYSE